MSFDYQFREVAISSFCFNILYLIISIELLGFFYYSYQGMIKGYSGVFRLGEATSTWDADSPVSQ